MARATKKVGIAGKYATRYGVKIRNLLRNVEEKAAAKHKCPSCESISVRRTSTGIFKCRHCNYTFTSGAYFPTSEKGTAVTSKAVDEMADTVPKADSSKKV